MARPKATPLSMPFNGPWPKTPDRPQATRAWRIMSVIGHAQSASSQDTRIWLIVSHFGQRNQGDKNMLVLIV